MISESEVPLLDPLETKDTSSNTGLDPKNPISVNFICLTFTIDTLAFNLGIYSKNSVYIYLFSNLYSC